MDTALASPKTDEFRGTLKVSADSFAEYKRLKAEHAACKAKYEAIVEQWEQANGLPKATADTAGRYVIVNGNGDEIGKIKIFWRDAEKKIRVGHWRREIS